jgi:hypothetical protein
LFQSVVFFHAHKFFILSDPNESSIIVGLVALLFRSRDTADGSSKLQQVRPTMNFSLYVLCESTQGVVSVHTLEMLISNAVRLMIII